MATFFKQYSTVTSGTVTAQDSKQDVVVIHNAISLAVTLTVAFPATPVDGQQFTVISALGVTTLTLTSALTIVGGIVALAAGGFASWLYDKNADKWFRCG